MVDKRNATGSWSGYLHQGKVGILLALIEINRLLENDEDVSTWKIEYESAEDIDIKYGNEVISRHQVKANKNARYPNDYKDVRTILIKDSDENITTKGFNIDNVSAESRFLHVIREVEGFDMSQEEFKENFSGAKPIFVPNLSEVRLYRYPNGNEYCSLDDSENDNELKGFCVSEIARILGGKKPEYCEDLDFQELKYLQLQELLDARIRAAHLNGQSTSPEIDFNEFIECITNTKKIEQNYILHLRETFINCWEWYVLEIDEKVSENTYKKFKELIAEIHYLNDTDFLQFFRDMNPDKISSTDQITIGEMTDLCNKDSIKDIFYDLLFRVENKDFKIEKRGYDEHEGYLLTLINRPKKRVKTLVEDMLKNTRLTEAIFNKRYLINGQIDDVRISEDVLKAKNWGDETTSADNIFHSDMKFIDGKLQVQVSHPDKPVSACCN